MATKPVVVGVDGSEESLRAVEWAALEARRHASLLRIVSAPAPMPRVSGAHHPSPETAAVALRGIAVRALGAAITRVQEVAPGLSAEAGLLSGSPAAAVADCGPDASMLVVGARGAGGFAAMMLRSVSRYAAAHARCPVVVVREGSAAVHREIAVGIRDPEDTTGTLAFAFEEASLRRADLIAVHAWTRFPSAVHLPGPGQTAELPLADPEQISAAAASTLATTLDRWRDKYPDVMVRQDIIPGHPARVLASYSARVDLVVIGRHPLPGGEGPGTGRMVQHAVLDHAPGPVAVVPVPH
jgi:nucleotide-binding universal stress UspA family protein